AVSRLTTDDEEAWWPPTFRPSTAGRALAACTIHAESQSTRRWMRSRTSRSVIPPRASAAPSSAPAAPCPEVYVSAADAEPAPTWGNPVEWERGRRAVDLAKDDAGRSAGTVRRAR